VPSAIETKAQVAIARIKEFLPTAGPQGYYLAFSGGKDSIVLKDLAERSGVKHDCHYAVTTIDPPELVRFIKRFHPDVKWDRPKMPFLRMLETRGFPIRQGRWCCAEYKENWGVGRTILTGIRWEESKNRSNRRMVESCLGGGYKSQAKHFVHPIIDWSKEDIWSYIKERKLPYCSLYDEGWKRIGCLLCPMSYYTRRLKEIERYPRYAAAYLKSFRKLYANRKAAGRVSVDRWASGDDMFWWWIGSQKDGKPEVIEKTRRLFYSLEDESQDEEA
jgi:phosphoadenosine phosphosulfate reductase